MKYKLLLLFTIASFAANAQSNSYWQQHIQYEMEIDMDVTTHQFEGKQKIVYTNNSPDTLTKVYYHLYFNAFQPGSMMDIRSQNISDPDRRVGNRIAGLTESEIGYQHINQLKQNGKKVEYSVQGTILEVSLRKPILPGKKATFSMEFEAQVPLQIRRSGRDNAEGISYSMAQWYPKLAEYDYMGWHPNPYIGREFHGVWGDFDVKINIDSKYILGGTGYVQNGDEVGYGYGEEPSSRPEKLTWHFNAPMVHDFMWAADPDYKHVTAKVPNGPTLHFLYQDEEEYREAWEKLPEYMVRGMEYVSTNFGEYPYEQYSFIQGGDGGMEYPMATLITGNRSFERLLGVSVHEMIHNWYQGLLATNESLYEWMDEGFTSFADDETIAYLLDKDISASHAGSYRGYFAMAKSGNEEPLTTHADHYKANRSYGLNAYSKGAVFLGQLEYIVGRDTFMKGMRRYFNTWKYKHPTPNNLMRILEKESGMELDWYVEHFMNTTNQIDYGIKAAVSKESKTYITLERHGDMMMPIDLNITYNDGTEEIYNIPLRIMRGTKDQENEIMMQTSEPWPWTYPTYTMEIGKSIDSIKSIEIDRSTRMADIDRSNNLVEVDQMTVPFKDPTFKK